MSNYNIIQIVPEVTMIEDTDTCIYVVEGEKSAIVIDTGYGCYNLKEAVEEITKKPLTVICTHGHIDHASGSHYFDKVYMHEADMPVYEKHRKFKIQFKDKTAKDFNLSLSEVEIWSKSSPKEIEFVSNGQTFDIGGNVLEVIMLSGHTPGSIGLIDRKHRILFSGDGIITYVWMQLPESTTIAEYLETVKSIKPYCKEFDTIYMGHRRNYKPVSYIDDLEIVLSDILSGCKGQPYDNEIASGMVYGRGECSVVYDPNKIR
jgi:glyoxylase-like metal-dependent hydrolase (beta-lactamase superfamily II)